MECNHCIEQHCISAFDFRSKSDEMTEVIDYDAEPMKKGI